jgi:hypothetical protein
MRFDAATAEMIQQGFRFEEFTKCIYVDAVNGSDGNDGLSITNARKSFAGGWAALTAAKNEAMIVVPGASGLNTTSKIDWNKAATHLVGLSPQVMNNRCRLYSTPLLTISAANCRFYNFLVSAEGNHATYMAVPVYVTGHRNYFENFHIRNIGAAAVVDNSHRALKLGSIYDTHFVRCQFGETSYDAVTAASTVIEFAGTDSGKYIFDDCLILGAGSSSATFFTMGANVGGFTLFRRCFFHNSTISDLDSMTQAFSISGTGNDGVFLMDCLVSGVTALETSDSGVLFGRNALANTTTDRIVALTS